MSKLQKLRFTEKKPVSSRWKFNSYKSSLATAHVEGKRLYKQFGAFYLVYKNGSKYEIYLNKNLLK